jgi:FkbM family methyltransferase
MGIRAYVNNLGVVGVGLFFAEKLLRKKGIVTVFHKYLNNKISFRFASTDLITLSDSINEFELPSTFKPLIVVDVGVNVGLATAYFSSQYPSARVFSIEAEYKSFLVLKEQSKNFTNITPIHSAVWSSIGTLEVRDRGTDDWGFVVDCDEIDNLPVVGTINTTTMQYLMDSNNIQYIDLLKVDINGAEKEVFGINNDWIDKVGNIFIKIHERMSKRAEESVFLAYS